LPHPWSMVLPPPQVGPSLCVSSSLRSKSQNEHESKIIKMTSNNSTPWTCADKLTCTLLPWLSPKDRSMGLNLVVHNFLVHFDSLCGCVCVCERETPPWSFLRAHIWTRSGLTKHGYGTSASASCQRWSRWMDHNDRVHQQACHPSYVFVFEKGNITQSPSNFCDARFRTTYRLRPTWSWNNNVFHIGGNIIIIFLSFLFSFFRLSITF
jgi:hypothetical protein